MTGTGAGSGTSYGISTGTWAASTCIGCSCIRNCMGIVVIVVANMMAGIVASSAVDTTSIETDISIIINIDIGGDTGICASDMTSTETTGTGKRHQLWREQMHGSIGGHPYLGQHLSYRQVFDHGAQARIHLSCRLLTLCID
ncbi:uncharacterized protein Dmoj_GI26410, isoform B [Drosophila mojavensis]|uniref:Uncharacterized protein, isoform A n=1 Tax=Drosophila mojavensis TaxID=7230 RepID=A0A0Q9XH68_DROMO|nr:uncharacterized protein Dmoj_GI26410, isoform A [Drosophila mojavensis]KRG07804.1 uncharacterized protein Dmoj_GI26410, isoform B [Drosophila mojavensis]